MMKKKTKNRLISFFSRAKRERLIVIASLSVAFLALLTLVIVLASSLFITERLKLVNEIEKNLTLFLSFKEETLIHTPFYQKRELRVLHYMTHEALLWSHMDKFIICFLSLQLVRKLIKMKITT